MRIGLPEGPCRIIGGWASMRDQLAAYATMASLARVETMYFVLVGLLTSPEYSMDSKSQSMARCRAAQARTSGPLARLQAPVRSGWQARPALHTRLGQGLRVPYLIRLEISMAQPEAARVSSLNRP